LCLTVTHVTLQSTFNTAITALGAEHMDGCTTSCIQISIYKVHG
jgi:hypothetical protein